MSTPNYFDDDVDMSGMPGAFDFAFDQPPRKRRTSHKDDSTTATSTSTSTPSTSYTTSSATTAGPSRTIPSASLPGRPYAHLAPRSAQVIGHRRVEKLKAIMSLEHNVRSFSHLLDDSNQAVIDQRCAARVFGGDAICRCQMMCRNKF